ARDLGRAGIVVFPGQHDDRAFLRIDAPDALARVPFAAIEADVAPEHAVAALRVLPPDFARPLGRALRRHQAVHPFGDEGRLVDLRVARPGHFAPHDALAR